MPQSTRQPAEGRIVIRGARTHNLQNIDVTLPKRQVIVVTGVSGSGKSSLAFDTVYAEGQRRYVESLSAYARQFLERMEKPDVDRIDGICPAIAIRQKNSIRNPRSTVGTTTEVQDYLRVLFARIGRTMCRGCGAEVVRDTAEAAAGLLAARPAGTRLLVGFETPLPAGADAAGALEALRRKGFGRLLLDGRAVSFENVDAAGLDGRPLLHVVVDRVIIGPEVGPDVLARLTDSIETGYAEGEGTAFAVETAAPDAADGAPAGAVHEFSERFECRACRIGYEAPQPRLFSFNSPFGACPTCHGFGNVIELDMALVVPDPSRSILRDAIEPWSKPSYRSHLAALKKAARGRDVRLDVPWSDLTADERRFVIEGEGAYRGIRGFFRWLESKKYVMHIRVFLSRYRGYVTCPDCGGARLRPEARDVQVGGRTIDEVCRLTVGAARAFFDELALTDREAEIVDRVRREIRRRLSFLEDVGLDYLTLDRLSSTLSGGEAQRINLATALGSALVGSLYVLDEPSVGLHPRDNERLMGILARLRDQQNTVLVVEHDADMIRAADYVIDLGLGAGASGGRVVFAGPVAALGREPTSLTAKYLRGDLAIAAPPTRRKRAPGTPVVRVRGASEHNLQDLDVELPLNMLTCVTGVSGSGKSTLVHDVLYAAIKRATGGWDRRVGAHRGIEGAAALSDAVLVDQTPIGRTPRSNPVTYLKAFDPIRELFSRTREARTRGLTASHFSFNVPGGRCDGCDGEGVVRVEMQFLADVFVPCDECGATRFKPQVLEVTYGGRNVHDVLQMTVQEALHFFGASAKVLRRLAVLDEIGLGYLRLGQPATTLSGGEAQRVKIAAHLGSRRPGRTLYVFDEPTTGLHFDDIAKLLAAFRKLLQAGHSLLVIEHNLDVIKTADWIIDLGPEGGAGGGRIVAAGTPEQVAECPDSHTGRHLRPVLETARARAAAD